MKEKTFGYPAITATKTLKIPNGNNSKNLTKKAKKYSGKTVLTPIFLIMTFTLWQPTTVHCTV